MTRGGTNVCWLLLFVATLPGCRELDPSLEESERAMFPLTTVTVVAAL